MPDPDHPGKFIPDQDKIEVARRVINLRRRGGGYGEISSRLGLKVSTVRAIVEHKSLYSDIEN
jgi:DNA-binding CsgD family transcriptional regulator